MSEVRIRDIVAKQGEKAAGFLDVGTTSTTTCKVPVVIFNGLKSGPTLAVLAGIHGAEYTSIEGVQRVMKEVDPKELSGTLIVVPIMNLANFERRIALFSPIDNLNQNRVWPGDPNGTISQRVCHVVFTEISSRADAQIDCHGGDLHEDISPGFVMVSRYGPEKVDKMALEMAECFNGDFVEVCKPSPNPTYEKLASTTVASKLGIPALLIECGVPYPLREEEIEFTRAGVINVMKYLKMLKGEPRRTKPLEDPPTDWIKCKRGGIFHSFVDRDSDIKAGQVVAEVTDVFGNVLDTYVSSINGKLAFRRVHYAVNAGEPLLMITDLKK